MVNALTDYVLLAIENIVCCELEAININWFQQNQLKSGFQHFDECKDQRLERFRTYNEIRSELIPNTPISIGLRIQILSWNEIVQNDTNLHVMLALKHYNDFKRNFL